MARGVNKAILVGTLGQDPEVKFMPNGNAVCNLSLATSESWTDKQSGQKVEKTEWHRVTLYNKVAEIAGEYLRKGSQVYIEGKLQTREWEKDGVKRYTTEIVVDINGTMQLLGGKPNSQGQGNSQPQQSRPQPAADKGKGKDSGDVGSDGGSGKSAPQPAPDFDSFDDDIPFRSAN